jgi:hypothetical protein
VTQLASTTRSTKLGRSVAGQAMPTGVMRMAAPLVAPLRPTCSIGTPAATAATAAFVDGPSKSSEPRLRMSCSQESRSAASWYGSMRPLPATSSLPTNSACSVSSVTEPAGMFGAIGWSGGPGWNSARVP